jgi:hypothetical protein
MMSMERPDWLNDQMRMILGPPEAPFWNQSAETAVNILNTAIANKTNKVHLLGVDWRTDYGKMQREEFLLGLGSIASNISNDDLPVREHITPSGKKFKDIERAVIGEEKPTIVYETIIWTPREGKKIGMLFTANTEELPPPEVTEKVREIDCVIQARLLDQNSKSMVPGIASNTVFYPQDTQRF